MALREFDMANYLDSPEAIYAHIHQTIANDPDLLISAIGDAARAYGMTKLSKETGVSREALYRALSDNGNPTYETLSKVLAAFGITLDVRPMNNEELCLQPS